MCVFYMEVVGACELGWRCDKVVDIYSGCALSLPNLTYPILHLSAHTPPLCVEIKVGVHTHTHTHTHTLALLVIVGSPS